MAWAAASGIRAGDQPLDFVLEFANPHAGARGNRDHGTAQFGAEFRHVNADAVAPGHVHHVQRHDDGTIQFEHLADEKKIPFEVRRVHDDQRRVGRGVIFQPPVQRVAGEFFIRRRAFQAVKPRQIHDDNLVVAEVRAADAALDGGAGKIGGLGAQAGQRVEQGGLAGVGIADQREREGVMRQMTAVRPSSQQDAADPNFTASLMLVRFPHRAMVGRADFQPDPRGQRGGQPQPRAENADHERVAGPDDLQPASDADAERLEPLHVVAVGLDAAHDGALPRRQRVQPRFRRRR